MVMAANTDQGRGGGLRENSAGNAGVRFMRGRGTGLGPGRNMGPGRSMGLGAGRGLSRELGKALGLSACLGASLGLLAIEACFTGAWAGAGGSGAVPGMAPGVEDDARGGAGGLDTGDGSGLANGGVSVAVGVAAGGGGGAMSADGSGGMGGGWWDGATSLFAPGAAGGSGASGVALIAGLVSGAAGGAGVTHEAPAGVFAGGGGGGGGVGATTGVALTLTSEADLRGGAGGAGGFGSGGGGGAAGLFTSADVTIMADGLVSGGGGGDGATAGGGGGGGVALVAGTRITVANEGALGGGAGGASASGGGGDGGDGVLLRSGGLLVNGQNGVIRGGAAGADGALAAEQGLRAARGGVAVRGADLAVINSGLIEGGLAAGSERAHAVQFTGGVNSLELRASSRVVGIAEAASPADTLILGGAASATFDTALVGPDAQYRGFGLYRKHGTGRWDLTGATSALTPWTLAAGTLAIGSDAALGHAAGRLAFDGGALLITADAVLVRQIAVGAAGGRMDIPAGVRAGLSGDIAGPGAFGKAGDGALVITGAAAFGGGVTISGGAMHIGDGGGSGTLAGPVRNDGRLVFDRSGQLDYAGVISGGGAIVQQGPGRTSLGGDSSGFTGVVEVTAGALLVNGALGGVTHVRSGALVGGGGALGALVVHSGATVAPGGPDAAGSAGDGAARALSVSGDYRQDAGGVFVARVTPAGADRIIVGGAAVLADGAILKVSHSGAPWTPGTQYPVLSAACGVTGTYTVTGETRISQFLSLLPGQTAGEVHLRVVQTGAPEDVAETPNEGAANGGAGGGGGGSGSSGSGSNGSGAGGSGGDDNPAARVRIGLLNAPDSFSARRGLLQISGAYQASLNGALLQGGDRLRELAMERMRWGLRKRCGADTASWREGPAQRACLAKDGEVWATGWAFAGRRSSTRDAPGLRARVEGLVAGVDADVSSTWRLGALMAYSRNRLDAPAWGSNAVADTWALGVHGAVRIDAVALRAGASSGWTRLDTRRRVDLPGVGGLLAANRRARIDQVFAEAGYGLGLGQVRLEPWIGLAAIRLHTGAFAERGGAAALRGGATAASAVWATVGVRGETDMATAMGAVTARASVALRQRLGGGAPMGAFAFDGGAPFTVTGAALSRTTLALGASLEARPAPGVSASINVDGEVGQRGLAYGGRMGLAVEF